MRSLLLGVGVLLATTASGGIEHTMLHGVSVGQVRVAVQPESLPGFGEEHLQAIAETGVRKAGLPVTGEGDARFFLSASIMSAVPGACFVRLEASVVEEARLERNGLRLYASSWSQGGSVASDTPEQCARLAAEAANGIMDDFIEEYRAMNPQQATR